MKPIQNILRGRNALIHQHIYTYILHIISVHQQTQPNIAQTRKQAPEKHTSSVPRPWCARLINETRTLHCTVSDDKCGRRVCVCSCVLVETATCDCANKRVWRACETPPPSLSINKTQFTASTIVVVLVLDSWANSVKLETRTYERNKSRCVRLRRPACNAIHQCIVLSASAALQGAHISTDF